MPGMSSRELRRRDRALGEEEAREILARAEHGVLATVGADGWPYAVPVNHVLSGDVLYFHCAVEGHKLENIVHDERVSFCAVAGATVLPEKLSTLYESAIAFGRAHLVRAPEAEKAITAWDRDTAVVRIRIEQIAGKAHRPA